jgi:plasmid stabilization system protein ParE
MSVIRRRPGVDQDIFDIAEYLLGHSPQAARRFVDAVEETLKDLSATPGFGSRKEFAAPGLAEVRSWWIKGFESFLIYYLPLFDGIDVLAIMRGSRDTERWLKPRVAE